MERIIKEALKKEKDIERLKIKIFSKTLNKKHNLKIKNLYILQIQPYTCTKHTKEKLILLEGCITNKLFENIDTYYHKKEATDNLINIISEKNSHIYPNYINCEKYIFEKMTKYIAQKKVIDHSLEIINKIKAQKGSSRKSKKYYNADEVSNDFRNSIIDEGVKIKRKQSMKKKRKSKAVVILLKQDKNKDINNFKKIMEKRENMILINELKKSMKKVNDYKYKFKIKSANLLYDFLDKKIRAIKKDAYEQTMKYLKKKFEQFNQKRSSTYQKTVVIPLSHKLKKKIKFNRFSLMERKSLVPQLIDIFQNNVFNNKKHIFRPVYLFSKEFNKEYKEFNNFFRDWNNNRDKKMINDIYKYTEENFNINHNILYSQINKLIKNNKLDNLNKELSQNKNDNKRFNTISNFSSKNKKNSFFKNKRDIDSKNIYYTKDKLLMNLKYKL